MISAAKQLQQNCERRIQIEETARDLCYQVLRNEYDAHIFRTKKELQDLPTSSNKIMEIEQRSPWRIVFKLVCKAFVASGQDMGTQSEGARRAVG